MKVRVRSRQLGLPSPVGLRDWLPRKTELLRASFSALVGVALAGSVMTGVGVASTSLNATIEAPTASIHGRATTLTLRLPATVAAVDARVVVRKEAAQLIGLAPLGGGQTMTPIEVPEGYAFAAYGLRPTNGRTTVRLIVVPLLSGRAEIRVVIDAAANAAGRRVVLADSEAVVRLQVDRGTLLRQAPLGARRNAAPRAAGPTRDLFGRGVVAPEDLDIARAAWYQARVQGDPCKFGADSVDANGDGCIDVVDLQALLADQGTQTGFQPLVASRDRDIIDTRFTASLEGSPSLPAAAAQAPLTLVVTDAADTPDASPGNGICADSLGRCTLRAAMTEANWRPGEDRIQFNLPGTAPVRIQLTTGLPPVGSAGGGAIIDGYSQPGSQPNSAPFGTNATPGVEIRGTGRSMSFAFYVPRAGSTIRGLLINNTYSGIFVDTSSAVNNRIVGNFIGFNADGSLPARGRAGVWLNNGATGTIVGTPVLADRNVIGNYDKGVYSYGAGTDGAIVQNNVLCIRPNELGATCQIGIDHDFGPKGSLIGGAGANERNVIGPTTLNGIELSHGWDPSTGQSTTTWQINDHRVIDNWIGFRSDGHYDPNFRVAQNVPTVDNGQGVNIYDGSNRNLVEGNHIGSAHDGLTIGMSNSTGNIVRDNIVGESAYGEAVPMDGWGIYLYSNTWQHTIEGNIFRNAADGGIALLDHNIRRIRISRNTVTGTNGSAIYLAPDPNDPTTGANALLPWPIVTESTTTRAGGTGIAGATVEVFKASRAFGQAGLPIQLLGSTVVAGNGTWVVDYGSALQTGDRVTSLQIAVNDNTSALSSNVYAGGPPPAPVADFTWSQLAGSLRVDFTDASGGSPTAWLWQFGDGATSTQQHPTRTYGAGGDYTVTLTASNATGSVARTQTVTVDPLPPGTVLAADTFNRTSSGTWDNAETGGPYRLEATLGNYSVTGSAGTMILPQAFANRAALLDQVAVRDVDVTFRVRTDKAAAGSQHYVYAIVRGNGNNAYRPKLILYPNGSVAVHSGVLVNNVESSTGPAVVVPGLSHLANTYLWVHAEVTGASPTTIRVKAWADGQPEPAGWQFTATNSNPAVQSAGSVGLRVYVDAVTNAPVTFSFDDYLVKTPGVPPPPPPPTADFTFSQLAGTLQANFTDTSTGSPTSWAWDFGDGTSSTQRNPSTTYASAGSYSVTLTATNGSGSDSRTETVTVDAPPPAPTADFTYSQQTGTLQVSFSDTTTDGPASWNWDFGDGTTSTQQNPVKSYQSAGDYSVTLTVSNASGSDSIDQTVTVMAPAVTTYVMDGFGRTVSNAWGSADIGGAYSLEGSASNFYVAGGVGSFVLPSGGANRSALLNAVSARDVDLLFRVRTDRIAANGTQYVYAIVRRNGTNAYRPKIIMYSNGSVAVHCGVLINNVESSVAPAVTVPGLSYSANGFIWVRAQVSGTAPTTIRVKAWADGQAEPSGWQFTATNSQPAVQTAGGVGLRVYLSGGTTNAPVTFGFDDFQVTSTP